jgi:hypothetical protein
MPAFPCGAGRRSGVVVATLLPLLIGWFRYSAIRAVILNTAMSLVVVAAALPFRASAVPLMQVTAS